MNRITPSLVFMECTRLPQTVHLRQLHSNFPKEWKFIYEPKDFELNMYNYVSYSDPWALCLMHVEIAAFLDCCRLSHLGNSCIKTYSWYFL